VRGSSSFNALRARTAELAGFDHELLLDLDDTIITNMIMFMRSRDAIGPLLVALDRQGRSEADLLDLHEQTSAVLYPEHGATRRRWQLATTQTTAAAAGRPLTAAEETELLAAAKIAAGLGELYPGVTETLTLLQDAGIKLGLVTKGESELQEQKIAAHDLARFFEGRIAIVSHKDGALLRELAERFGFANPLVIGDSAASDVAPALAAGFPAVQIDHGADASIWKHESWQGGEAPKVASFPDAILHLLDVRAAALAA